MFRKFNSTLFHYLQIYGKFVSINVSQAMSFRVSFILLITMDLCFYFSTLGSVSFIFDHIQNIGPWGHHQLMFFISFMLAIDHLHITLVSESFWILSREIKSGGMDYILLKPVSSIFTIFFGHFRPATILNGLVAWGFIIYYGTKLNFSLLTWSLLPLMVVLGFNLLIVIEFIISTSMFWLQEGLGINFLRMQIQQISRWPDFIYASLSRKFFTIVCPILLIGSAPVKFIFDFKNYHFLFLLIGFLIPSWAILNFIWKKGLIHYESASS